jgi:hypothetical protein
MWTVVNILLAVFVVWMVVKLVQADWRLHEKIYEMRQPPKKITVRYKGSGLEE